MPIFRRLLGFLRPYTAAVLWSFVLAGGAMVATVLIPYLTGRAIDAISTATSDELVVLGDRDRRRRAGPARR